MQTIIEVNLVCLKNETDMYKEMNTPYRNFV